MALGVWFLLQGTIYLTQAVEPATSIAIISGVITVLAAAVSVEDLDKPYIQSVGPATFESYEGGPDGINDWYVGQERKVKVKVQAHFGEINECCCRTGRIKLDVKTSDGTIIKQFNKTVDDDPTNGTCNTKPDFNLKKKESGEFTFEFSVEAVDDGPVDLQFVARAKGYRENPGAGRDHEEHSPDKYFTQPLTLIHPLKKSSSGKMGWLDPVALLHNHAECPVQALKVRNCSNDTGDFEVVKIGKHERTGPEIAANADSSCRFSTLSSGPLRHEQPIHVGSVDWATPWFLSNNNSGTSLRLDLDSGKEYRDEAEDYDAAQKANTCAADTDPNVTICTVIPTHEAPSLRPISDTYLLEIVSLGGGSHRAANRALQLINVGGLGEIYPLTTDPNGFFTIDTGVVDIGPTVTLDLVMGPDAWKYQPHLIENFSVGLLDDTEPAHFTEFSIAEAYAPPILGTVKDGVGDINARITVMPGGVGPEVELDQVTGTYEVGGLPLYQVDDGSGTTTLRIYPEPEFNVAYDEPYIEVTASTGASITADATFTRSPPINGAVLFSGTLWKELPPGPNAPLAGLIIQVGGTGGPFRTTTDTTGQFSLSIPGPAEIRSVSLVNAASLEINPVDYPGPELIHFGQGGDTLVLEETLRIGLVDIPTVSEWGLIIMVLLFLTLATFVLSRRENSSTRTG